MKDRFPYILSLMFGIAAACGWLKWGWGKFTIFCAVGAGIYAVGGFVANAFKAKRPRPEGPQLAPDGQQYGMGRILMYASFLVFLVSFLRNDFHTATTYWLYYAIPMYLALRYITGRPRR